MNTIKYFALFFMFCFSVSQLSATLCCKTYHLDPYIGPEIYYVDRVKEGGAKQDGTLYGVRIGYDRVKRYKLYWGIDALWAQGILEGGKKKKGPAGETIKDRLKSEMTDMNVEARIGYTFQSKWRCFSVTPFVGLGYFWEKNFYKHPTPLHIHFTNSFTYIPAGFLSQIFITPTWSIGLNFKIRYLLEAEQKSDGDPDYGKLKQNYEERVQYRGELPISYFYCWGQHPLAVSFVPFYEYRPYGHRANFPFDFLEVKLKLYGAIVKFQYLF